ncbi:MAG: hypothetical protein RIE86_27805 [Imperialibacter sp.]|uniref:hypothetical protein n=1 Tax=Imperialibacter sp. TaxID=2038411 RepID=UPI0032EFDA71
MKFYVFFILLLPTLVFGRFQNSEKPDSLPLHFYSSHEQKFFYDALQEKNKHYFSLFMSVDSAYSRKSMLMDSNYFYSHLSNLMAKPKPTKKYTKYLKPIYDDLHSTFLRKYVLENSFSDVFTKGEYNCVSAVILYGIALSALEIPYEIKETPTHVYIVAKPGGEQIVIETTDPINGYNKITPGFKQNFIETLVNGKLIGSSEYNGGNTDVLFDEYYFKAKSIGLKELAGVQYTNSGIFFFEKKDYLKALWQFDKSYHLYKNEKTESLIYLSGVSYISGSDYVSAEPVKVLAKLLKLENTKPERKEVEGEFGRITVEMLSNRYDTKMYDEAYQILAGAIDDQVLKSNIDYIYNYERGRNLVMRKRYKAALPYLEAAYLIRPTNFETESLFASSLAASFESEKHFSDQVEKYKEKFPKLLKNETFSNLLSTSYLLEMYDYYSQNKAIDASLFKDKFEKMIDEQGVTVKQHDLLGGAYSQAAVYHFKMGETNKARSILNKGLQYSPNNYELRSRLMMLNR